MSYVDSTFKSPLTSISIGPGIRGIERGVERVVRLRNILNVEIEAFIVENLVAQMERLLLDPALFWSDAKNCPWELFQGLVDILFAGYPCQPFSTAGKRRGTEDHRHLYPYIERAIRIIRPRACFFENVRGHVTCGLPEVIASLERLGYRVHWGIYSAEETGAAHKRERVFILAVANSEGSGIWRRLGNIHKEDGRSNGKLPFVANRSSEAMADPGLLGQEVGQQQAGGEGMGDTNNPGLQGWISGIGEERTGERLTRANGPFARVARPGEPQQAWEHPRVISRKAESSMGLSAHGYHFREDILRALGNSVYADTAELAFIDLIRKHGIV